MLVLSRKKDESIMINNDIEIKILSIDGEQIKIGIVAPKNVKVHRSEIFEAIQAENHASLNIEASILQGITKSNSSEKK
ncbi:MULTISPECIES: carbon storage regulator CsrA [Lysinibacillus]|uniref:carbon storage regulator CsrA n=1 Tax=Lysinibacillus TaxID=400634 RepID=UPI00214AB629|nr:MULTISPECIES: carbon storage regulator CsrA [Lysinibacillus]UUV25131.1 carbon storage regulator CsrA [Lysinibacillus sp. FN11]UYB48003.1 carbon storage regulator CsrA [Lysinibacillus capsici]